MNTTANRRSLLVFARQPTPGRVKTRLIPTLGAETATIIYSRMLQDSLASAAQVAADRRALWVDRLDPGEQLTDLAERYGMSVRVQTGRDLGDRMHAALIESLRGADSAVLIGSDCPGYDAQYLDAAFRALEQHDAVLGPAADGGYVLIGLRATNPSLFTDIYWGTDQVLAATRDRLARLRWTWHELPLRHDVDDAKDLLRYPHLAALAGMQPLKTRSN